MRLQIYGTDFRSSFRACVLIALIFSSSSIYAQGLVAIINTSKGVIEAELNDRAALLQQLQILLI